MVTVAMKLKEAYSLEKEMATHSSVLAWRIPGTGEPGGLPFMGSHRVGHNWSDLATPWKESHDQPTQHINKQAYYFANKGLSSQGYDFSSSHVWMWELDCEEGWVPKNWYFWTVILEKTLESPLDCKEIQPVHPIGNHSWILIRRTDVEAEIPVLWLSDAKNWLVGKDPDAGKNWGWEEKGMTEDEMVGWHHRLNGHEFG